MKIRVHCEVTTSLGYGVAEIEVPDNASDNDKDKAALEWADSVTNIWWEDVE